MAKRPWKGKDYFVSPWNYADEVTKDFGLPKKVKFHDITLRDGEQQSGLVFRKGDKVRVLERLSDEEDGAVGPNHTEGHDGHGEQDLDQGESAGVSVCVQHWSPCRQ